MKGVAVPKIGGLTDIFQKEDNILDRITAKNMAFNKGDAKLNNLEIAEHMIFLLLAAHDTTTITLTNSIYNLFKNKDYAHDLFNEANEVDHLDVSSLKNGIVAESIFKEVILDISPIIKSDPKSKFCSNFKESFSK